MDGRSDVATGRCLTRDIRWQQHIEFRHVQLTESDISAWVENTLFSECEGVGKKGVRSRSRLMCARGSTDLVCDLPHRCG